MRSHQLDSILNDPALAEEMKRVLPPGAIDTGHFESFDPAVPEPVGDGAPLEPFMVGADDPLPPAAPAGGRAATRYVLRDGGFEAIVKRLGRPSLVVRNGTFEVPESDVWKGRLYPTKSRLERAIRSVGRLELLHHSMSWVGTAWLVADDIIVTNRHVALVFAQRKGNGFSFRVSPFGEPYAARLDFREEHLQAASFEVEVEEVLYVTEDDDEHPDIAFLRLRRTAGVPLPEPIPLAATAPVEGQTIAVVGYPAFDDRNNVEDMARIFGGAYGVKRLAPGEVRGLLPDGGFTHDCTTLGGNSGSCVLDVATGAAVGLHFAGEYERANYAVGAEVLREYLKRLAGGGPPNGLSALPPSEIEFEEEGPRETAESLSLRGGYDPRFLGEGGFEVPLPAATSAVEKAAARLVHVPGRAEEYVLDYTNFSVVVNKQRRLAAYTATNIDGGEIKIVKRKSDVWRYDPRIEREAQVGHEVYRGTDFDRGHLTRRLDPAWGDEYERAEKDTFYFTNCTPQHHNFNTKTWLGLEDYLLSAAETHGFRACIFTGPVFGRRDRPHTFTNKEGDPDSILIPLRYWKVTVMLKEGGKGLSATGYVISQADLVSNIEFAFGQYLTYQVSVSAVEKMTGLDFGSLRRHDPLGRQEGRPFRELTTTRDIVI
jgi:endonuclease G